MKSLLNVGGASKAIPIPRYYAGWQHLLLDIDPRGNPDVVMDARELRNLPAATYDAIYCSHNLEHYHRGDAARVIEGFRHILKEDGFAEIRVPDLLAVVKHVAQHGMDLDDTLYVSPSGPIMVRDVFFGWSMQVEQRGNDFFAHKTGFSPKSLAKFMNGKGFETFAIVSHSPFEITGYFFKQHPSQELWSMLNLAGNVPERGAK